MSVDLKAPSTEQFTAFMKGDEGTLMSLFRGQYDALIALAKEALGAEFCPFANLRLYIKRKLHATC